MNKKLILNTLAFQVIGAIIFTLTYLLTFFDIISENDTLINGIIFVIISAACLSWYSFVNYKYYNSADTKDCVLLIIMVLVFDSPMILMSLKRVGIHISVAAVLLGTVLLIFANNIIHILEQKDDLAYSEDKKYTNIISKLKLWRFFVAFGPYLFGGVNVFIPLDFASAM